ncbi:MAG: hypothetical protein MJ145_01475, partial [Clostridia bacterium]|nr:hypothetical protein [Clostridia bacterium]
GTVIYGATQDVSVAVQAGKEEQEDGMTFEFTRALVTIDNADAPKEYSFKFDLPEGYKLVTDKEYCEKYATEEEKEWYNSLEDGFANELYVLDADNQIVQTIDPAWAKDANGNDVDSYYEIKGDELVQVVNFDEDTAFPVVADPTTRPDKYKYTSVSKETIKKLRDSYAPNVTLGKLATYLGILSAGAITDPVVAVWVSTAVAQYEQYKVTHYDFYSATYKALVKKKKSYVRFKMRYVYRKKQGGVYVLYKIFEDDYTNTKGEDRVVYK